MPVKMTIKANWDGMTEKGIQAGLLEMATDIQSRSVVIAPIDTGALRNSGKVSPVTDGYKVSFGGSKVPYARRQYFEHKAKSHWLEKAADGIARGNLSKYWRNKV
ncbi:hypothetical protein EOL73_03805 [Candidatus Saccharibacteria bacterium]|nr:hypothetical protein [Candidatus Saccharibacteria bacterium]